MTRRGWLLLSMGAAACGPAPEETPLLPENAGAWRLESAVRPVPDRVGSAKAAWRATYAGNPAMSLTVYAMPAETSAFDALQRWRPEKGKLAFYKGRYFCIAASPDAPFADLNRFTTSMQAVLGGKR